MNSGQQIYEVVQNVLTIINTTNRTLWMHRAGFNFPITIMSMSWFCVNSYSEHMFAAHLECWASAPALTQLLWLYTKSWRYALRWPQTGRGWSPERLSCFHLHKTKSVHTFFCPKHVGRSSIITVYSGISKMIPTGRTPRKCCRRSRCCLENRQHFPECSQTLPLRV